MSVQDFQLVQTNEKPAAAPRAKAQKDTTDDNKAAAQFLNLMFATLSARTVAIFSAAFTVAGLVSCFWLWSQILIAPSVFQLAGGTIYCVFVILLEIVRKRYAMER